MTPGVTPNTQAILLLTAPMIAGPATGTSDLLSLGEYNRLARHLRELQRQPADLLTAGASELLGECHTVVDPGRLERLLGRGFRLSQVIDRWQTRAIWVVSRADAEYPRRLKVRLREDAPAVLYGCGDIRLLDTGGLAVVGSRHVDDNLVHYTMVIARLLARAGRTVVSGGAKGVDRAAMRGALEEGGKVCGVLADSLEDAAMNRENRDLLMDRKLVLVSRYDPNAGFNVGNAMQRNKLIYALADAALVVNADLNKGGTWTGAIEQLERLKLVPVFVRSTGEPSAGLQALEKKGAARWPEPQDVEALARVFDTLTPPARSELQSLPLPIDDVPLTIDRYSEQNPTTDDRDRQPATIGVSEVSVDALRPPTTTLAFDESLSVSGTHTEGLGADSPATKLFQTVSETLQGMLTMPMTEAEIASVLDVSVAQARAWLQRLVKDGQLARMGKPPRYVLKSQPSLLSHEEEGRLRRTANRGR